jgi:hypothetical protein
VRRSLLAVLVLAMWHAPAAGQALEDYDYENLALSGIGFQTGRLWPSKVLPATEYALRLDLGLLGPGVRISSAISYWQSRFQQSELERLVDGLNRLRRDAGGTPFSIDDLGEIHWSSLTMSADAQGVWRTPWRLHPYAGVGLGIHAMNGRGEAIQDTFVEDFLDTISLGISVAGGVEYEPFRRLRLFTEARYTVLSNIHHGGVHVGAMLLLPSAWEAVR